MYEHDQWHTSAGTRPARRRFLQTAALVGAGLALGDALPLSTLAAGPPPPARGKSIRDIINAALLAERLATTIYYTAVTTITMTGDASLAEMPTAAGPVSHHRTAPTLAYLRATLDQEQQHARMLMQLGAHSSSTTFHVPASTFERVGYTSHAGTLLWVLDHLETAIIGLYLTVIERCAARGRTDLTILAMRILAMECAHRALYRAVSADDPADNVTLEVAAHGGEGMAAFRPFLTGRGFAHGAPPTRTIHLPTAAQIAQVMGRHTSSHMRSRGNNVAS